MSATLPPEYFDRVYAASDDPWNFAESPYEQAKYAATLAALSRPHYRRALEIGCSIGILTAQLARRCDQLIATDVSEQAISLARSRCRDLENVNLQRGDVSSAYPAGCFELTILSEVGYYFDLSALERLAGKMAAHAPRGGELLLVHWLPVVPDYPLTGDQVHELFLTHPAWQHRDGFRQEYYRLDRFERRA